MLADLAAPAGAVASTVAVVPLASDGDLPAADRLAMEVAIAGELRDAGNRVLGSAESATLLQQRDPSSLTSRSLAAISTVLVEGGWDTIVTGRIGIEGEGRGATLTLEAFETRGARPLVERGETGFASDAGRERLVNLARTTARGLWERVARVPRTSRVRISTDPPRAHVSVNGARRGDAPLDLEVPAGPAVFRAEREGFVPAIREVVLHAGEPEQVFLRLEQESGAPSLPPRSARAPWQLPIGVGALVAGLGLSAYGTYGLVRAGCLEEDDLGCVRRLGDSDRVVFGAIPLVAGLGIAAVGTLVAFVFELGQQRGESP